MAVMILSQSLVHQGGVLGIETQVLAAIRVGLSLNPLFIRAAF